MIDKSWAELRMMLGSYDDKLSINSIKHHGIKGQKWGVRHGPPYPIEDTVMKAGQRLEHVSRYDTKLNTNGLLDHFRKNKKLLYVYNPEENWDNFVYKGPFAKFLKDYILKSKQPELHSFVVKEDLKMPTKKERVDAFLKLLEKPKDKSITAALVRAEYIEELSAVRDHLADRGIRSRYASENIYNIDFKNLKTDRDIKDAYEIFNHAMEFSYQYKVTKAYVEYMSNKFDAMVDDNNQSIYNFARDPVIIMNVNKLAASEKAAEYLKDTEIQQRCNVLEKVMNEHGFKMQL